MTCLTEGNLQFQFPEGYDAVHYDEWAFYRNQFQNVAGGSKAVDFIYLDGAEKWLIEVKDYRVYWRTKPSCLSEELAIKVRDNLAGIAAASCNANDPHEKQIAKRALRTGRWIVVLHLEQPRVVSKIGIESNLPAYSYSSAIGLFNSVINFALIITVNEIAKRVSNTSLW